MLFERLTGRVGSFSRFTTGKERATATQAEQETGTSITVDVTPGRQNFHPSAAKFWCKYDGTTTGTFAPSVSFNVTDITDNSTGTQTVNVATDFSSGDWVVVAISDRPNTDINAQAAGTVQVRTGDESSSAEFGAADATAVYVAGFGDQA